MWSLACNKVINSNTLYSPFKIAYGFNLLTPLDLLLLSNTSLLKHKDGKAYASFVKKLHEQLKLKIEKKSESYAKHANKGMKRVVFKPGDWVWVHMSKERFLTQRKSKLQPRGDGPVQVLERINGDDNFNSGSNSLQEGGDDEDIIVKDTG
ncbi:uncharacterized protein LOC131647130 [Vicia villosa]|uniref:uncharacterized protein LOC131647130 n=1 Tax=Vicia villosa TaxID=3911 RepID=UPI00273BA277|nr:uncharacterized protein LOC131647130 [Vicia villosa]XP_058773028.1 uncharacterized protein LOC131647130 [Vicia villosa]